MADINKFTTKEVLNKVLLDSSGDAVAAFSHTSQEALNAVLDTANNRLNISLVGGAISGDLTVSGDLIVSGGGSQAFDEIITGSSSIKSTTEGSATAGAQFRLFTDDGSTMESGDRLGFIEFAGAEDASNNIIVGASIQAFTEAQWSATENGTSLKFFTTDANNSHSEVLALDSNKNATFAGAISANGGISLPEGQKLFYGGTSRAVGSNTANIQVDADVSEGGGISMVRNSANANGVTLTLGKSRGNSHNEANVVLDNDVLGTIEFAGADGADITPRGASISSLVDGTPGSNVMPGSLVFATTKASEQTPTTALTVDSSQNSTFVGDILGSSDIIGSGDIVGLFTKHILHGSANSIRVGSQEAQVQIKTNHQHTASLSLHQSHNNANAPKLTLGKSRDNNVDTVNVAVVDNDLLGTIEFAGCDGTDINTIGANIVAKVNGTPGGNDMPTELIFSTTADGASSPTVAFSLDSSQNATFGGNIIQADNTVGADNVVIGHEAFNNIANANGKENVVVGNEAMQGVGTAADNDANSSVAIGFQALKIVFDADNNTMVGYKAGDGVTTGESNSGFGSGVSFDVDANNQTAIGAGATTDGANKIAIGNTSVTAIEGQVDFAAFSDKRIKKDIVDNDLGLDFINNLKPRKFKKVNPAKYPKSIKTKNDGLNQIWTDEQANKVWDGLIAQEVKEAIDKAGTTFSGWSGESNSKQSISYSTLVMPLIKAVQELTKRVKELESK